jgi:D-arabinose 1-dehydrogenase-like Zn-dependent alcohol dehydrogenase
MAEPRNQAVLLEHYGEPESLHVVDVPVPTPGPGEVRIRVLASSVNYTETLIRRRLYPQTAAYKLPFVMGYDVVGEIDEVGPAVTEWKIGDRVADMTVTGSDAVYRTLRANDLTRVPCDVDPAEAATLILSWTTAYQLLHRSGKVRAGQRILVHGAGGAVGHLARCSDQRRPAAERTDGLISQIVRELRTDLRGVRRSLHARARKGFQELVSPTSIRFCVSALIELFCARGRGDGSARVSV